MCQLPTNHNKTINAQWQRFTWHLPSVSLERWQLTQPTTASLNTHTTNNSHPTTASDSDPNLKPIPTPPLLNARLPPRLTLPDPMSVLSLSTDFLRSWSPARDSGIGYIFVLDVPCFVQGCPSKGKQPYVPIQQQPHEPPASCQSIHPL